MKIREITKLVVALSVLVVLFSCTTYGPDGAMGGYSDFPLGGGRYKVSASGNGYTSEARVRAIALKRAAELTLEEGRKYFYIIDDQGNTTSDPMLISNRYGTTFTTVRRHSFELTILITDDSDGIDAQEMFESPRV